MQQSTRDGTNFIDILVIADLKITFVLNALHRKCEYEAGGVLGGVGVGWRYIHQSIKTTKNSKRKNR